MKAEKIARETETNGGQMIFSQLKKMAKVISR
jgi:hypothetical protein